MTRIFISIIVLGLFCRCTTSSDENYLSSISLANPMYANDTLDIVTFDNLTLKDSTIIPIVLDSVGNGSVKFTLSNATFVTIKMKEVLTILIFPNERIDIQYSEDQFTISGDQGINEKLNEIGNVLNEVYVINGQPFFRSDEGSFKSKLSVSKLKVDSLKMEYLSKMNPDKSKMDLLISELDSRMNNMIINYYLVNQNNDTNFLDLLVSSSSLLKANSTSYYAHLQMFLDARYVFPIWNQHKDDPEMRFNYFPRVLNDSITNSYLAPDIKEYLLAKSIFNYYQSGGISDILDSVFMEYSSIYSKNEYSNKISNYNSSFQQFIEGSKAPEINSLDIKDKSHSLYSLLDKPIVIDFWATWCGSCIQQMKYVEKLKRKYKSDIKFIYVSLDANRNKWKKFVESRNLQGIHLIAADPEVVKRNYIIGGVPRYVMINRNGEIFKVTTPLPSSDLFEKYLLQLIGQSSKSM